MGRTGLFQHGCELFFCDWKLQLLKKQWNTQVPSTLNVPCRSWQRRVQSASPACMCQLSCPGLTRPLAVSLHFCRSIFMFQETWWPLATPHMGPESLTQTLQTESSCCSGRGLSPTWSPQSFLWAIRAPKENRNWVWTRGWKQVARYELKVVYWTH